MSKNSSRHHSYNRENFRSYNSTKFYFYEEEMFGDDYYEYPWTDDDYFYYEWGNDIEIIKEMEFNESLLLCFDFEIFGICDIFKSNDEEWKNILRLYKNKMA